MTAGIRGVDLFYKRSELKSVSHALTALLTLGLALLVAYGLFRAIDGSFPGSTLVSTGVVLGLGLVLASVFIRGHASLSARWGAHAYAVAFRWLLVPGLTLVFAGLAHIELIEGNPIVPRPVVLILSAYLLLTALLLWVRAVWTAGLDTLSLLYVYFPAESRLVDSRVYGLLRHPVYSAMLRAIFLLVLDNGSALALVAGLLVPFVWTLWLRGVEEAELIERFGESYRAYRARVPGLFNLDPRAWPGLWRFMLTGA